MIIGFTGTRSGMTNFQKEIVKEELLKKKPECVIHGGCIGADEDFHKIAKELGIKITVYPGHSAVDGDTSFHFDYSDADEIFPSESYFKRNRRIVDDSDFMLATPYSQEQKGGTWYTIKYSKDKGKGINVI